MKRVVVLAVLLSALFVTVTIARRGSPSGAGPKPNEVVEGVTGATAQGGDNLLCIGTSAHDPHATCAGVEYPGQEPGCLFLFKQTGGQKISARYVISPQTAWQPLTLDGQKPKC